MKISLGIFIFPGAKKKRSACCGLQRLDKGRPRRIHDHLTDVKLEGEKTCVVTPDLFDRAWLFSIKCFFYLFLAHIAATE